VLAGDVARPIWNCKRDRPGGRCFVVQRNNRSGMPHWSINYRSQSSGGD